MAENDIVKSVEIVGRPWKHAAYYDRAEASTSRFWDQQTPFRIQFNKLDLTSVLELACGHGRHSNQIVEKCNRLVLMDIHEENLEVCRKRFQTFGQVRILKGSGYDFVPIGDSELSSIFCYDAMVHFSADVVRSYVKDTARVLRPGGRALYHHSNNSNLPRGGTFRDGKGWRNRMSKEEFAGYAAEFGLKVQDAVVIDWGGVSNLDCITMLQKLN
jgi:ubiquinone/menaquinone biosynthesis C-methylase UbiE